MTATWRKRLRERYSEDLQASRHENDSSASLDDLDTTQNRANLDSARQWDPFAAYSEELQMRLAGSGTERHGLGASLGDLLPNMQDVIEELGFAKLKIELSGLSAGSTVLHFRATGPDVDTEGGLPTPVDDTQFSEASRAFLHMMASLESRKDVTQWSKALKPTLKLVERLQHENLLAWFKWRSPAGRTSSTRLTSSGMSYLKELQKLTDKKRPRSISGNITQLNANGRAKVKVGAARNSTAFEVIFSDKSDATLKSARLGDNVSWTVEEKTRVNKLGEAVETTYTFAHVTEHGGATRPLI